MTCSTAELGITELATARKRGLFCGIVAHTVPSVSLTIDTAEVTLPDFVAELMSDRPRTDAELGELFAGGWPAFIEADRETAKALPRVRELFADLEVVLVDRRSDTLVAACWAIPIRWDGTLGDLPAGYSDSLTRALNDHDSGAGVNTAVVCAAQVKPDLIRNGLAAELLSALLTVAADRGLPRAIAPLRLTRKHRYPLTSMDDYLSWTRPDGSPFDPWLRTHLALGAHVLKAAPASQEFTGTCAQWEEWADLLMPATGTYIVRDALAPLHLDRHTDHGTMTEPAVWVQHR